MFGLLLCCCFVFACMRVLRVIAYALAFECCEVAFHIRRVCRLHVGFAFVSLVCFFVLVCMCCE